MALHTKPQGTTHLGTAPQGTGRGAARRVIGRLRPGRHLSAQDLATCPDLTPVEVARALEDHHSRTHLLGNPRLPVYLQVKMSASTLLDARTSLAANPGILPRVQLLLARCPDDLARMALARNPALTQEAAEVLAWDEDLEVSRQALRNASVELTGTMALHLHRWRPSYFGGSSSSAAYQALSRRLPNRVLESLVGSHGRTWSFDDLLAFTDAASRLDPETLEVLLDGFTGTPAELLELASELGPTALPV